jgi:hypothetical protein
MKSTSRSIRGVVGTLLAVALFAVPGFASAQSAAVVTKQVLPVGGNSCTPVFVSEVTPYIYEGELQSFDIILSDASYVGLFGQAGDVAIPFNYMSRDVLPNGSLRLHIDTTAAVDTAIPVVVTLLASKQTGTSTITCLTQVAFTTNAEGVITPENPTTVPVVDGSTDTTDNTGGSTGGSSAGTGSGRGSTAGGTNGTVQGNTTTVQGTTSSTSTSIGEVIGRMCTKAGSYQLWFILLAIFFVIVAFVGLSQPPLTTRHEVLPAALIGVPLLLLLGLWYWVPDCRLSWLIPLILFVVAAIGLYSAYRTSTIMRPAPSQTDKK